MTSPHACARGLRPLGRTVRRPHRIASRCHPPPRPPGSAAEGDAATGLLPCGTQATAVGPSATPSRPDVPMKNSTSTDMTVLQGACEALTEQGWGARLVRHWLCGERDVRLHVCGPQPCLEVEVLGPHEESPVGDRWAAVRVDGDERIVWAGPPRGCASRELFQFAVDLLLASVAELQVSYRRLN